MSNPIDLRCPVCQAQPGRRCRTLTTGRTTDTHTRRPNAIGFTGRDDRDRQQCLTCWGWKFPATHSCPGVPQPGRVPPDSDGRQGFSHDCRFEYCTAPPGQCDTPE